MSRIVLYFYGVNRDDRHSKIAAKILKRKYKDPYPLTHVVLKVDKLYLEYLGSFFRIRESLPLPEVVKFSYSMPTTPAISMDYINQFNELRKDYPCNFSMVNYFKPNVPWCTDFIYRLLFGHQGDYLQIPPWVLLENLTVSELGFLEAYGT